MDYGIKYTDKEIDKLERKIRKVYDGAKEEMQAKLDEFNAAFSIKDAIYKQKLGNGEIALEDYQAWLRGQVFQRKQWEAKVEQIADITYKANVESMRIINGSAISVFAENATWMHYDMEHSQGVNFGFGIYDSRTVTNLIANEPNLLPKKTVDESKDKAWNYKKVTSQVTQGIIQGEGIDDIAKRLSTSLGSQNMNSMLTYARTAMTGAQNAGRYQGLADAKAFGIDVVKEWMATLDGHTRISHRQLDGEQQKVGDKWHPFKFSNGCRYPGDPAGPPAEVYNCRCTLVGDVLEYPSSYERYDNVDGVPIKNMSYEKWKAVKTSMTPELAAAQAHLDEMQKLVDNTKGIDKVFSGIWYKQDVTYADWESKKDSVQSKMDWYLQHINDARDELVQECCGGNEDYYDCLIIHDSWKDFLDDDFLTSESMKLTGKSLEDIRLDFDNLHIGHSYELDLMSQWGKHFGDLAEFQSNGPAYSQLLMDLQKAKLDVKLATPMIHGQQFSMDAWDEVTKQAASRFSDARSADKFHRAYLDSMWDDLSDHQKYSVWEYTRNSNPINKSLSGYHESWSRSSYIGPLNTEWGHENSYRRLSGGEFGRFAVNGHVDYHSAITDLTLAIDRSSLPGDVFLVRGSDEGGLAGLMEGNLFSFDEAMNLVNGDVQTLRNALVGQPLQGHSFLSTGIAEGTGFGGKVKYNIYAPQGTHGIYAEPQSYFGNTASNHIYQVGEWYSNVGGEAEVILQRGTTYRVTDVYKIGNTIHVDMEVIDQPDYFKYGDEDTFNAGATRHKN